MTCKTFCSAHSATDRINNAYWGIKFLMLRVLQLAYTSVLKPFAVLVHAVLPEYQLELTDQVI